MSPKSSVLLLHAFRNTFDCEPCCGKQQKEEATSHPVASPERSLYEDYIQAKPVRSIRISHPEAKHKSFAEALLLHRNSQA